VLVAPASAADLIVMPIKGTMNLTSTIIAQIALITSLANACKDLGEYTVSEFRGKPTVYFANNDSTKSISATYISSIGNFIGAVGIIDKSRILRDEMSCLNTVMKSLNISLPISDSSSEISWVLLNDGNNTIPPSNWIYGDGEIFESYCTLIQNEANGKEPRRFEQLINTYFGDDNGFGQSMDEFLLCYYKHNNKTEDQSIRRFNFGNIELIVTRHGLVLKESKRYRWVYLSDHLEKLRWESILSASMSNGIIELIVHNPSDPPDENKSVRYRISALNGEVTKIK